jgi:ABC-type amino acid transport substrate-binding protein
MGDASTRVFTYMAMIGAVVVLASGCKAQPARQAAGPVEKLGQTLAGAPEVAAEDLLKDPSSFEGKIVRVSGKVEDFCVHKRAWFAVQGKEGAPMVRVFTTPRFQVPADAKGKRAIAEGRVEVIVLDPAQAEYYLKEHKFLANLDRKPNESVRLPIVRAFGVEFSVN